MHDLEPIRVVCRYIEQHTDEALTLDALAAMAGLSKYHFARRFKAAVGVTLKEYASAARLRRLKDGLKDDRSIDAAVYEAGYGLPSRVYENAARNLGMTSAQYRAAGQGVSISYAVLETPLGPMLIGATDRGICFAQFGESEEELRNKLRAEHVNAEIAPMLQPYHPDFAKSDGCDCPPSRGRTAGSRPSRSISAPRPFKCAFGSICSRSPAVTLHRTERSLPASGARRQAGPWRTPSVATPSHLSSRATASFATRAR